MRHLPYGCEPPVRRFHFTIEGIRQLVRDLNDAWDHDPNDRFLEFAIFIKGAMQHYAHVPCISALEDRHESQIDDLGWALTEKLIKIRKANRR